MSTNKRIDWVDRDYHLEENEWLAVTEGDGRAGVLHKVSGSPPPKVGKARAPNKFRPWEQQRQRSCGRKEPRVS